MESELFITNNSPSSSKGATPIDLTLHKLVWHNNVSDLAKYLTEKKGEYDIAVRDPHGRSPLHLAISLGHFESSRLLLEHGASALVENSRNWTVVQEAVSTGDVEMVRMCLEHRDHQRHLLRLNSLPSLLQALAQAPDFYIEMKWEFTSWVPLVSRICPSDTYKVWKSGSNVRIDTTLLGFDNMSWQRGNRSYLFKLNGDTTSLLEVDYDNCQVYSESLIGTEEPPSIRSMRSTDVTVALRLTSPLVTTFVDVDKIAFERSKCGVWGWRSDKVDVVDNYNCKVFSATNVNLTTKTRTEHLSEENKKKNKKQCRTPFESLLGYAEADPANQKEDMASTSSTTSPSHNPSHVTEEDYFNETACSVDIGRPVEETIKVQRLKARFWLCEDYPLSLPQQVLPIIDLMASSNTHFRKLKDFIALQLPSGFPVKIEIPLFHVLNANITFGNLLSRDQPVDGVTLVSHDREGGGMTCDIDDSIFNVPTSYSVIGDTFHERMQDEDDQLYQFTLRQSLLQQHSDNKEGNLRRAQSNYIGIASEDERLLQWALEESLKESRSMVAISSSSPPSSVSSSSLHNNQALTDLQTPLYQPQLPQPHQPQLPHLPNQPQQPYQSHLLHQPQPQELQPHQPQPDQSQQPPPYQPQPQNYFDDEIRLALELSEREEEGEKRRREEEERELELIMQLSLKEK